MVILIFLQQKEKNKIDRANALIFFIYFKGYRESLSNIDKNQLIRHIEKIKKIIQIIV